MKKKLFALFIVILFLASVSASFIIGDSSFFIEKEYAPSDYLKGWINLSLEDEPITSMFTTNLFDGISLLDLIQANLLNEDDYNCIPPDCDIDYESVPESGSTGKSIILNDGEDRIYGISITGGDITEISNFSLEVSSDSLEWFSPQLYIDFFADGIVEWQAYNPSGSFGSENYGCYNGPPASSAQIFNRPYCESVTLSESPSVRIGADVIEEDSMGEEVDFLMTIQSQDGFYYGSCTATAQGSGKVWCSPSEFQVIEDGDFFVCISTQSQTDDDKYLINHESYEPCGFTDYYTGSFSRDFEIFAKSGTFDSVGTFTLNNDELENAGSYNSDLEYDLWRYLGTRYGRDCSDECIIPLRFISGYGNSGIDDGGFDPHAQTVDEDQHNIILSNLVLEYTTDIRETADKLYNLVEVPAKIDSGFLELSLDDAELFVPAEYGNFSFVLRLGTEQIFSEIITIQMFPEINFVTPTRTAAAVPTIFRVSANVSDDVNITSYDWDFGDNQSLTTVEDTAEHTYDYSGTYTLTVSATDTQDLTSFKEFEITVDSPKTAVRTELIRKKGDLIAIQSDMDDFNPFQKDSLDQIFNLTDIENKINQIQSTYDSSTIDTDEQVYITMMEELLEINLPNSLEITKNADSLLFYPREENIDVEIVSAISEEEYQASKREDYVTSILFWNQENLETKIGFKEITAAYDDYEEVILRTFEFDISKDYAEPTSPYLIIESLGDLRFKENYFEQEQGGYFSIQLHDTNTMIEFSTTDDVDFVNIPAFISPVLSDLSLIDGSPQGGEIEWKWAIVGLIIVLIILLGLAASTFLKKWYKTKDETRLFKNKRDLHNIISYINRMKKKGMSKGDLIYNLRKAHWTNEQIRYAMKRYSKKNKGVFEIPVEKILEKVKEKSGKNAPRRY